MHIEQGVYLTDEAKYLEAIAHYDQALNIFSYIAASYYHKGKEEFELGNYTLAIKNYSQAIYLNSILLEANIDHRQLMEAYIEREQAISKLQNRNAINQDWETNSYNIYLSNIYLGRGVASYKWGDKDNAYKSFNKAKIFGNKKAIKWLENFQYDKKDPSSKLYNKYK